MKPQKIKQLGIPYMGAKRKLAPKLIECMLNENPKAKYFFDLFGGGGSMSLYASTLSNFKRVHYNEFLLRLAL